MSCGWTRRTRPSYGSPACAPRPRKPARRAESTPPPILQAANIHPKAARIFLGGCIHHHAPPASGFSVFFLTPPARANAIFSITQYAGNLRDLKVPMGSVEPENHGGIGSCAKRR